MSISDLDIDRVAVKKNDKKLKHKMIPVDRLIRYNFLEIIIRLTQRKFIYNKICSNFQEAITLLVSDFLKPYFGLLDPCIWRKNKLWNEHCDLALKS